MEVCRDASYSVHHRSTMRACAYLGLTYRACDPGPTEDGPRISQGEPPSPMGPALRDLSIAAR